MLDYFKKFWEKGLDFKGRTSRKDYWMTVLTMFIASIIIGFVLGLFFPFSYNVNYVTGDIQTSGSQIGILISAVWEIAVIIPSLAMTIRRLHDIGKSGWWIFIACIPVVGWIWYFILLISPSKQ